MITIEPKEFYDFLKDQFEKEYFLVDPYGICTIGFLDNLNDFINNKINLTHNEPDLTELAVNSEEPHKPS